MKLYSRFSCMAVTLLALCGLVWADEAPTTTQTEAPAPAEEQVSTLPIYGMQMWIDQDTGELRAPTREEAAHLSGMIRKMFAGKAAKPEMRRLKNGTLVAELGESMMEFAVVRIAEDGSLERGCVDDAAQALEFVHNSADTAREEQ